MGSDRDGLKRAYKVRTLSTAKDDFKQIKQYLSQYSSNTAKKFFDEYKSKLDLIKIFPNMYEQSSIDPDYRRMIVGDFLVFYRVDEKTGIISIERAGHGSRDFQRLLTRQSSV